MAWTAPMTAIANSVFSAAQFNTHLRDNLNETAPAKATAAGRLIVTTGVNSIAERTPTDQYIATSEATSSTSYADLATVGPAVTVTTGPAALVFLNAQMANSTADAACYMGVAISGATTAAASDIGVHLRGAANNSQRAGAVVLHFPTPGSNTFTAKYKVSAGTGTFAIRQLIVVPL